MKGCLLVLLDLLLKVIVLVICVFLFFGFISLISECV